MAVVSGIREKVHTPIYDCLRVEPESKLGETEKSSTLRFFVDVQGKTKLETNLQSASLLPHYNTFEARAMRVVVSDLPPEFPDDGEVVLEDVPAKDGNNAAISVTVKMTVKRFADLYDEVNNADDASLPIVLQPGDDLEVGTAGAKDLAFDPDVLEAGLDSDDSPPPVQLDPENGGATLLGRLIYNSVTTLYVGEKVMVEAPTWMFPGGAGAYSERGKALTHGEPNPLATFRFAEPIFIDKQQNFRVEIEIPHKDDLEELQKMYGPLFIWVVLDGFMTRGVQ
jgi:hypothetical protein